jgi:lipoprotein-releasing system ATP-binding protein
MEKDFAVLRTSGLGKYFHSAVKFKVLDNIQLTVNKGEFVSLMGKSGSGKSTLLYCLSTMDTEYEGELYINEEKITGQKPEQLAALRNASIGFIFQFHYLLPEFTSLKNVMLPALKLKKYSPKEIEERAYVKLEILGIADQALKPTSKLSGGQQQRVSIARALINDPDIIMCDEPTGNLDTKNTRTVIDIFQRIAAEQNQSIIAVTHDPDFAQASHRVVEMADGRLISGNTFL